MISTATVRQILSSSSILLLSFLYGCKVGYTQSATALFMSPNATFVVTSEEISWIGSVSFSGTIISVFVCFTVGNKIGRKTFILGCIITYTMVWFLILVTSSGLVIILSLLAYGIAASMHMIIGCIYFGETATPENREILGMLYMLAMQIGIQIEYPISLLDNYRLLAIFPLIVSIITLVLCVLFMAESPYYLVSKDRIDEAATNTTWLNKGMWTHDDVTTHLDYVRRYTQEQKGMNISRFKTVFLPDNFKLLSLMVYICVATSFNTVQVMGYGALVISSFEHLVSGAWFVNMYNIIGLVSAIACLATIKIFNRRAMMLYGLLAVCTLFLACAACYYIEKVNNNNIPYLAVIIETLLIALAFISTTTVGAGLMVLKTEVFPQKLKEFYSSALAFTSDLSALVVSQTYFHYWKLIGMYSLLVTYAVVNFTALLIIFFFISDTKNKSLYQIRTEYATGNKNSTTHSALA